MLPFNLEQLSEAVLRKLCEEHCPESNSLDFKRDLPGGSDKEKQELLKDVCSLANTEGGDLVFGIDEMEGAAGALTPITTELADAAKRRISQVLDAGLDPRVRGIQLHQINVTGGYVLVVRVPASYDGPHCLRVNNNLRRFVLRNGTSTTDMTFDQLRSAFDRTASLSESARTFIDRRVDLLVERNVPKLLLNGAIAVAHMVPIVGLSGRQTVNLRALHGSEFPRFSQSDWGGCSRTFNFDGLVIHPGPATDDGRHYGYVLVFRNGAMESVALAGAKRDIGRGKSGQSCGQRNWCSSIETQLINSSRPQKIGDSLVLPCCALLFSMPEALNCCTEVLTDV
jgi:hypothetical protein